MTFHDRMNPEEESERLSAGSYHKPRLIICSLHYQVHSLLTVTCTLHSTQVVHDLHPTCHHTVTDIISFFIICSLKILIMLYISFYYYYYYHHYYYYYYYYHSSSSYLFIYFAFIFDITKNLK